MSRASACSFPLALSSVRRRGSAPREENAGICPRPTPWSIGPGLLPRRAPQGASARLREPASQRRRPVKHPSPASRDNTSPRPCGSRAGRKRRTRPGRSKSGRGTQPYFCTLPALRITVIVTRGARARCHPLRCEPKQSRRCRSARSWSCNVCLVLAAPRRVRTTRATAWPRRRAEHWGTEGGPTSRRY